MPNVNGFYPETNTPNNPKEGVENMKKYLSNPTLYGKGERCMKDCIKEDVNNLVMRIQDDLTATANEPLSTVRDLPKNDKSAQKPGQIEYENAGCSACHANAAIGAPVLGDKVAWDNIVKNGIDKVYYNGINGINSMPPKNKTDLSNNNVLIAPVVGQTINGQASVLVTSSWTPLRVAAIIGTGPSPETFWMAV